MLCLQKPNYLPNKSFSTKTVYMTTDYRKFLPYIIEPAKFIPFIITGRPISRIQIQIHFIFLSCNGIAVRCSRRFANLPRNFFDDFTTGSVKSKF